MNANITYCRRMVMILAVVVLAAGCRRHGVNLPSAPVVGQVTYLGKPLGFGRITFVHSSGHAAGAELAPDGTYKLTAYQGANKISIVCLDCDALGSNKRPMPGIEINGVPANKSMIPERYANYGTSDLTFEVKPGEDNNADFALKD
jgi:hypothetical protein